MYFRLPPKWRDGTVHFCYRYAGFLFAGFPHYESWRGLRGVDGSAANTSSRAKLVNLEAVTPLGMPPGRIAVHVHLYYPDLAAEVARYLRNMPFGFDLLVSVTDDTGRSACHTAFRALPKLLNMRVETVPNRGRDIAPMICTFGSVLREYDYVGHIHTKKSLYNDGATHGWREYLYGSLLGGKARLRRIFALLHQGDGMVYPQTFHRVPYAGCCWMANREAGRAWVARLGLAHFPPGYFDFPVGSMFWARADVLRPLFDAGITLEHFDEEQGQNDGTFAHVMERLLGIVAAESGRSIAILPDRQHPSWSPWRIEQYIHRRFEVSAGYLTAPEVGLVVFDVFDTLLTRPLVDPERIKQIVAQRAGAELGAVYLRWRAKAEQEARSRSGRDVSLAVIFDVFADLAGVDPATAEKLQRLEQATEMLSVSARRDAVELFRHVLSYGKRVVLASDMFLPVEVIVSMLENNGFAGWHDIYVSSEIGVRKDSGQLYDLILEREKLRPQQAVMVGDNERSDLQIPGDKGWRFMHVLRPVELARALPRFRPLVERVEQGGDLNADLGVGILLREIFGGLHCADGFDHTSLLPKPDGRHIGYAIGGPLVYAFTQWLIDRAMADGVERLYFLAREGQFLKIVYDEVAKDIPGAPESVYLVVSRRALNVPSIKSIDDVMVITASHYEPGRLEEFLLERFGLVLDDELREMLVTRGLWSEGDLVEITSDGIGSLDGILKALLPAILDHGRSEQPAILQYFDDCGLNDEGRFAVVDVGFSGTIQRGMNQLLGRKIHGYYMATLESAVAMQEQFGVTASGSYFDGAPRENAPLFIAKSFVSEKLLSANDTQLVRYSRDKSGTVSAVFRELSEEEEAVFPLRAAIRAGAMQFVHDAQSVERDLCPGFRFPLWLAAAVFESFVENLSGKESATIKGVTLDDHYCGRGLVN